MYKQMLNKQALKNITKLPQIPDYHLMVGSAENLSPLPLLLYSSATIPQAIIENMEQYKNMDNSKIEEMINNQQLEVNDLNWNIGSLGI